MEPPYDPGDAPNTPQSKTHSLEAYLQDLKNLIATDLPGQFPVTSVRGNKYLFLLHEYDTNFIYVVPIKSREATELLRGFQACYKELLDNGLSAKHIRYNNEISDLFIEHLEMANIDYQLHPLETT